MFFRNYSDLCKNIKFIVEIALAYLYTKEKFVFVFLKVMQFSRIPKKKAMNVL